jgi:hypothetical protein
MLIEHMFEVNPLDELCYFVIQSNNMTALLRRPSAFIPLLISGGFLVAFAIGIAQGTLVRQPDEGTGAHLFQILMPLQALVIAFFAITWIPKIPRPAGAVVALQCAAAFSVIAIVFFLGL